MPPIEQEPKNVPAGPHPSDRSDAEKKAGAMGDVARPLRTFQDDMASILEQGKTSVATVVAAEQTKRIERHEELPSDIAAQEEVKQNRTKLYILGGGGVLLLLSIGIVAFIFFGRTPPGVAPTVKFPPAPLFSVETRKEIPADKQKRDTLVKTITSERESATQSLGQIEQIYFSTGTLTGKRLLTAGELLTRLESAAPAALIRSLESDFAYGIFMSGYRDAFLVLRTNSFQIAFAGMLDWETSLHKDLGPLLLRLNAKQKTAGGTTQSFRDEIIDSKDVRTLRNTDGDLLLIYSFTDRSTIIIAGSVEALKEARNRLTAIKMVR